ncbi:MAG TPA: ribosome maturation factor RimP [Thermodesulfobacteriota bacterium]|nr:ribosome maturation factor RimP [Thermodesulfobacteriota bacterium]
MVSRDKDILFNVRELLEPILAGKNLELFDIEFKGQGKNGVLRVFIDREEGVTIDDCALVSRELGTLLDIHDMIPGSYTLEVSSPGLTRPLRKPEDFLRFKGKKVKIKTSRDIEKRKSFIGRLLDFRDGLVTVETEGGSFTIPYADIEKANLELDF